MRGERREARARDERGAGAGQKKSGPAVALHPRGAEEKKQKSDVPTYLPFLTFFEIFRSDLRKYFNGVFGLLMQRNGQKRD
jgi:hypothetical protein